MFFILAFLSGIFLQSFVEIPIIIDWELGVIGIFFLLFSLKRRESLIYFAVIVGLIIGIGRFQISENFLRQSPLRDYFGQEISAQGWICQEPEMSGTEQKLIFCPNEINDQSQKKLGRLNLITNLYPSYQYGQRLRIVGKLESLSGNSSMGQKLQSQGIIASINYPFVTTLPGQQGFGLKIVLLKTKHKFREVINQTFAEPSAGLLKSMFLGDRSSLSSLLKRKLAAIGLIHLIAISGLHLVILMSLFLVLVRNLKFKESWVIGGALIFLWLFVLMVGGRPSILRAAIMSSLLLLGDLVHRPAFNLRSLMIAAFIILLINPFSLRMDVGFQLSFLAVLGIIWIKPLLFRGKKLSLPVDLLGTTLAAQILIWPILLYYFGQISIISPLSNLLVTPLLPLFFGLGFTFLLLGACFPFLIVLGHILLGPLLWYFLMIINGLTQFPGITYSWSMPGWGLTIFYSLLLVFFVFRDPLRIFSWGRFPFQLSGRC